MLSPVPWQGAGSRLAYSCGESAEMGTDQLKGDLLTLPVPAAGRMKNLILLEAMERIAGCDIFPRDGAHRRWLPLQRARYCRPAGKTVVWVRQKPPLCDEGGAGDVP